VTKDVVIYSTQRSGTHFLASLLYSGAKIEDFGEIFAISDKKQKFFNYLRKYKNIDLDIILNEEKAFHEKLVDFLRENKNQQDDVCSFIVMYNQAYRFGEDVLAGLFTGRHVIHLVRRNVLRTHISDFINRNRLKPTHSRDAAVGEKVVKFQLPTENLVEVLDGRAEEITSRRAFVAPFDPVELHYEDLSADNDLLRGLADRFGFQDMSEFSSGFKKTNPQPLSEIVENFDAVQMVLQDTPFFALTMA